MEAEILTVILIWQFGDCIKVTKLTYAIIDPFIYYEHVFLQYSTQTVNLKSCQQQFLSKPPNTMVTNISA